MSLQVNNQGQIRSIVARGWTRRFLWMFAAIGCVSFLGITTALALMRLQLPTVASYTGELLDTAVTQTLVLPKGIGVEAFTVKNGARVTKGQTLVRLDLVSISATLRQVENKIVIDQQHLDCLQALQALQALQLSRLPTIAKKVDHFASGLDHEIPPVAQAEVLICKYETALHQVAIDALHAENAILTTRSALIDRRIKLELALLHEVSLRRSNSARLVLGLAWEQTRVEAKLAKNLQRCNEIAARAELEIAASIQLLRRTLHQNETARMDIQRIQKTPYLLSPVDAVILELNEIAPGQIFDSATPLISLVPIYPQRFSIGLNIPETPFTSLEENTVVSIEIIGTAMRWPLLVGHVTSFEPLKSHIDKDALQVRIMLEPESAAALAQMSARSGFVRNGSAIAVRAVVPERPLANAIINAWADARLLRIPASP